MTLTELLAQLEACGTAQNRKVYARHGAAGEMFGVSYANLYALQKKLKTNQPLAQQLWETGNYDARMLATLIADPAALSEKQAESWVKEVDCYPLADACGKLLARAPYAPQKVEQWHKSQNEWIASAGWNLLANLALLEHALPDSFFTPYLDLIEQGIHQQRNRVRHEMNGALIGIGVGCQTLEPRCLAIAQTIGKIVVDHGQTSCKTPDAAAYIKKANARKSSKVKAVSKA
jgi:3-methyladenine DNA glycosylase AlkD